MSIIAGIALIVGGAFFLFGGTFMSGGELLGFGGLSVSAGERHPLSPWLATLALLAGFHLAVDGLRRRSAGSRQ